MYILIAGGVLIAPLFAVIAMREDKGEDKAFCQSEPALYNFTLFIRDFNFNTIDPVFKA